MKTGTNIQPSFDFAGESLAIAGLTLAKESADKKVKGWSDDCWKLFLQWLRVQPRYSEFMIEAFREYVNKYDLLEAPPDNRAFAFLTKRALKENLIGHAGISKTKNKVSHARPTNVWFKK